MKLPHIITAGIHLTAVEADAHCSSPMLLYTAEVYMHSLSPLALPFSPSLPLPLSLSVILSRRAAEPATLALDGEKKNHSLFASANGRIIWKGNK